MTIFPASSVAFSRWAKKMQAAAMKMPEASLFIVPAKGSTKREMGLGTPYLSQAMKAFGSETTLK